MRTTIDKAGRVVIPKRLREEIGFVAGEVELTRDGAAIRIEPIIEKGAVERRGRLVIDSQVALSDEDVQSLRSADQR
jgi:AbrB family looped-hinge helix DNA binding protein